MFFFIILLLFSSNLTAMEPQKNLRKQMSETEIVDALTANTNYMIKSIFNAVDAVSVEFKDDISFTYSDIPDEAFNYILETHFTKETARARIGQTADYFKQKNVLWTWWVGPGDTPEDLEADLADSGFIKTEESIGMFCPIQKLTLPNKAGIFFQRVRNDTLLKDFYKVHDSHYFDTVWSKISPRFFQHSSDFEFYVGYVADKPVTAGLVVFHANIAGIYSVATSQDERKKGYATALMQFFLKRIEDRGYHYATLTAVDEAKNLYKKLGFKECCTLRAWTKR